MRSFVMTDYLSGRVTVKVGDITLENVDAVVNAANSSLLGGGGVDGAIHRAGGQAIIDECRIIRKKRYPNGLPTGQAIATTGGRLKADAVIHTVGPVWRGGSKDEEHLLGECYKNSLKIADELGLKSIAFPAVSTGVYGFPKKLAAKTASGAVKSFLENNTAMEKIIFVFFSGKDADIFIKENTF